MARITNPALDKNHAEALPTLREFQPYVGVNIEPARVTRLNIPKLVDLGLVVRELDDPNVQTADHEAHRYRLTDLGRSVLKADNEYEPPFFREFDELYNTLGGCDTNSPQLRVYVQQFEALLSKHPELRDNKFIAPCIENARGHCRSAGVPFRF